MSINDESRHEAILGEDADKRLLEAGRKVFREAYPNPERSGRFDSAALKAAASRSHREPLPADLVDELTWSSETFAEYERYLQEARVARRMRFLAACAAVVVASGAAFWWYLSGERQEPVIGRDEPKRQEAPTPQPGPDAPQRQAPAPEETYEVAVLDLRNQSRIRSEQGLGTAPAAPDAPVLPARRLDLRVHLPIGSEEGDYDLAVLRKPNEPMAAAQGTAQLANQIVTLGIRLDLSSLEPGSYFVGLRRGEFRWTYFQLRVE